MKRVKLEVDFNGPGGNVYYILAVTRKVLQKQQRIADYNNIWENVQKMNYAQALVEINKYVELVDVGQPKILKNLLKQGERINEYKKSNN